MSPGFFGDSWLNSSLLMVDVIIALVVTYGIRNYHFCLTIFGVIWLAVNGFVMVILYTTEHQVTGWSEWRYFTLAILCLFAFFSQSWYTHKV